MIKKEKNDQTGTQATRSRVLAQSLIRADSLSRLALVLSVRVGNYTKWNRMFFTGRRTN